MLFDIQTCTCVKLGFLKTETFDRIMATERNTKTTVKKSSEPKHVRDSKSTKTSTSPHPKGKKTPDPGPMKG